ncbi:MAG TPA: hypothetical protein VF489_06115 [Sphingobium sp.]
MLHLLLLASTAPQDQARAVMESQLRSPPRTEDAAGLSAPEAEIIRQHYLDSIGQRPPQPSEQDRARR